MEKSDGLDNDFDDDIDDIDSKFNDESKKKSYFEEQDEIKKSLKEAIKSADLVDEDVEDQDDGFLQVKSKTQEQKVKKLDVSNLSNLSYR